MILYRDDVRKEQNGQSPKQTVMRTRRDDDCCSGASRLQHQRPIAFPFLPNRFFKNYIHLYIYMIHIKCITTSKQNIIIYTQHMDARGQTVKVLYILFDVTNIVSDVSCFGIFVAEECS